MAVEERKRLLEEERAKTKAALQARRKAELEKKAAVEEAQRKRRESKGEARLQKAASAAKAESGRPVIKSGRPLKTLSVAAGEGSDAAIKRLSSPSRRTPLKRPSTADASRTALRTSSSKLGELSRPKTAPPGPSPSNLPRRKANVEQFLERSAQRDEEARVGLGRIDALYNRSSTSYQIH